MHGTSVVFDVDQKTTCPGQFCTATPILRGSKRLKIPKSERKEIELRSLQQSTRLDE